MYLPQEIVENILFRLPAESLLRLRAMCKHWKTTISDPRFIQTHLQQSNSNASFSCLVGAEPFTRVHLEHGKFRPVGNMSYPPPPRPSSIVIHSHCDDLYLVSSAIEFEEDSYILWNPSLRRHIALQYPYPLDRGSNPMTGICYDPSIEDYLVVIGDASHYAVFSCRACTWCRENEMTGSHASSGMPFSGGVSLDGGSIYWILWSERDGSTLVCFDGRDGEVRSVASGVGSRLGRMVSSRDALYVFVEAEWDPYTEVQIRNPEILTMKKVGGDAWMEIKVQLPYNYQDVIPLCCPEENKVIFGFHFPGKWKINFLLYGEISGTLQDISRSPGLGLYYIFPYVENMYMFGITDDDY